MPRIKKQHLKQRKDGRFCCRYHGYQFMAWTENEALALRDDFKRREANGDFLPSKMRFSQYSAQWLTDYKAHLENRGQSNIRTTFRQFTESVGDKTMAEYTPSEINRFFQRLAGKSISTLTKKRRLIQGVFHAAVADGLIPHSPAEDIKLPKGYKGTHRAITPQERLLIHLTQHRMRPAVMAMLYAGLRKGEALALDIERDIDFKRRTITVRQAVRFDVNGQPIITSPKTEAGVRTIPLLDILAAELQGKHGLLCPSASGKIMSMSAWASAWRSYNHAVGFSLRAHDLRHSFCTMLYDSGVDLKTAMLWMGHADQQTTMQIYTHLTDIRRTEAEKALRSAEKDGFRMQFGMPFTPKLSEPLKNKGEAEGEQLTLEEMLYGKKP